MLRKRFPLLIFIVLLSAVMFCAAGVFRVDAQQPTPTPAPQVLVAWDVDCDDLAVENGYYDRGYCVPGLISRDAWLAKGPDAFYGAVSSYEEGVMESVAANRRMGLGGYKDGVAVMSCGDIGRSVWIFGPDGWDGPFLAIDCSARRHMYTNVFNLQLAAEVGFKTTVRWGVRAIGRTMVAFGSIPPGADAPLYADWWLNNGLAFEWKPSMRRTLPTPTATSTPIPTATATPIPVLPPTEPAQVAPPQSKGVMDMDLLTGIFALYGTQLLTIASLTLAAVILRVAAALQSGVFEWRKIGEFLSTRLLPNLLGYLAAVLIARFAAPELLPGFPVATIEGATLALVLLTLVADIVANLQLLGWVPGAVRTPLANVGIPPAPAPDRIKS